MVRLLSWRFDRQVPSIGLDAPLLLCHITGLSLLNEVRGNLHHGTNMGGLPTSMIGSDRVASMITLRRHAP